ncbi:MAG: hypothetical protein GY725_24950 [bacterium]|nr:hypothetical protein [bacterium]
MRHALARPSITGKPCVPDRIDATMRLTSLRDHKERRSAMSSQAVTLNLPGSVFARYKRLAERTHRTVEAELVDVVSTAHPEDETLPPDLEAAVTELETEDDEELWRAARNRLSVETTERLEALHFKQRDRGLSDEERSTLARLLRNYERNMLVRARAAALLKERGHDVSVILTET